MARREACLAVALVAVLVARNGLLPGTVDACRVAAFLYLYVFLHEAGHALAAWRLGLALDEVRVGTGLLLLERRIGAVPWRLRAFPSTGEVRLVFPSSKPWKNVAVTLAGPALPVMVACLLPFGGFRTLAVLLSLANMLPFQGSDGSRALGYWRAWRRSRIHEAELPPR